MKINIKNKQKYNNWNNWRELRFILGYKKIDQVKAFRYLGKLVRKDMVCTQEMKAKITIVREAFNRNKLLLCSKMGRFRIKKMLAKC